MVYLRGGEGLRRGKGKEERKGGELLPVVLLL